MRARLHALSGLVSVAALLAAALLPGRAAPTIAATDQPCGLTTIDATLRARSDGTLECGPGEPITVRDDLADAKPGREAARTTLSAFLALADFQIVDEESPLRGEWTDKCESDRTDSAWRQQEALVPHMLNAHVKAASALAAAGAPATRAPYGFAIQVGDAADNQQYNEVRAFIDLLDGGTTVDPDSGADGYEGVQAKIRGGKPISSPTGDPLLDLANEPFYARGLRDANGAPLPWYSVVGNHDIKVQGTLPDDNPAWRAFARAWVTGSLKLQDLAPDHVNRVCDDPSLLTSPAFWQEVAAFPGAARLITPDPDRRLLDREDWIQEHFTTSGVPAGHGFAAPNRCRDEAGNVLSRACYSWNAGQIHFVVLDTAPAEGEQTGSIDPAQMAWLERDLAANSSKHFDVDGTTVTSQNPDRLIVVFSHHTISSTTNSAAGLTGASTGAALKALLLRFPNVVLQVSGHTHQNRIWAHQNDDLKTAYWEVNTSAVIDWPTQSRSIEIVDNHDGTLSVFGVMFDAAVPPNARAMVWADDPTPETAEDFGKLARKINEDWLASFGREAALNDHHADPAKAGKVADRNVELLIPHPLGVTSAGGNAPPPPPPSFDPGSFGGFPGFSPGLPQGFPRGFPGGAPGNFGQPGFVPPFQEPRPQTEIGLGAPQGGSPPWGARAGLLFLGAAAGGYWLMQARVRRWMIGI